MANATLRDAALHERELALCRCTNRRRQQLDGPVSGVLRLRVIQDAKVAARPS